MFEFPFLNAMRCISTSYNHVGNSIVYSGAWNSTNNALNNKAKPSVHYKFCMYLSQFSQQIILCYTVF